ncbi:uncharacterized protein [Centruroides vittatus]|uniref:uncharacterized protein n=1 Tax=Centruroides vittatus TaxID=120091 RepID=UPI00350FB673
MMNNVIEATILNGKFKRKDVLLPRILMIPTDMPFEFKRLQFPVRIAFAMTINKAQGQSLQVCGLDLENPCFSHGQLSFFALFSSWVVLATFVETLMEFGIISSSGKKDTVTRNLIFVSLYQSIRKLRSHCIRDRTAAFCGIKFCLICIVVFGHTFATLPSGTLEKYKNIPELYNYIPLEIAAAGIAMMEIFFFISAFLLSYSNQSSMKSAVDIFILLVRRMIRYKRIQILRKIVLKSYFTQTQNGGQRHVG